VRNFPALLGNKYLVYTQIRMYIKNMKNSGQFKRGYTYRKPKPYWEKEWLLDNYVGQKKSASQIAKEQLCNENNILYFLQKFGIKTRSMSEVRKNKKWGARGKDNSMYGRTGRLNPHWNGGHSPERQSAYARYAWKELAKKILKRDNYLCRVCMAKHSLKTKLIVHHIKPWSAFPKLRFESSNLLTLCKKCHKNEHNGRR